MPRRPLTEAELPAYRDMPTEPDVLDSWRLIVAFTLSLGSPDEYNPPSPGPRGGSLVVFALPPNHPLSHATCVPACGAARRGGCVAHPPIRRPSMGKKLYVGN